MERRSDYATLSWRNSFLDFEFGSTLYTCCLQILLVARMEWNYGILGRDMSSEMTASSEMFAV